MTVVTCSRRAVSSRREPDAKTVLAIHLLKIASSTVAAMVLGWMVGHALFRWLARVERDGGRRVVLGAVFVMYGARELAGGNDFIAAFVAGLMVRWAAHQNSAEAELFAFAGYLADMAIRFEKAFGLEPTGCCGCKLLMIWLRRESMRRISESRNLQLQPDSHRRQCGRAALLVKRRCHPGETGPFHIQLSYVLHRTASKPG